MANTLYHYPQITVVFRDISITSMSGVTQNVAGQDNSRQFLFVENTGNGNIGLNCSGPATGGTGPGGVGNDATVGSSGTMTIVPNGSLLVDRVVPSNPINVKGGAGQPLTVVVA